MIMSSSPPSASPAKLRSLNLLLAPGLSSPTYRNGETSPFTASFNASFAASMSITSGSPIDSTISSNSFVPSTIRSPLYCMDISPAPLHTTLISSSSDLANQLSSVKPPQFQLIHAVPDSIETSILSSCLPPPLLSSDARAVTPCTIASIPQSVVSTRPSNALESHSFQFITSTDALGTTTGLASAWTAPRRTTSMPPPPLPIRCEQSNHITSLRPTVPLWNQNPVKLSSAPPGSLKPPPLAPAKRFSDPGVCTFSTLVSTLIDSSPSRMDVDSPGRILGSPNSNRPFGHPRSLSDSYATSPTKYEPHTGDTIFGSGSGAPEGLADLFDNDLSPIRPSRKRFLAHDIENSPTLTSPTPAPSAFNHPAGRRSFEKSITVSTLSTRRRSGTGGQTLSRRPSLVNFRAMDPPPPPTTSTSFSSFSSSSSHQPVMIVGSSSSSSSSTSSSSRTIEMSGSYKRQAQVLDGKPMPKLMRRAYSVADAFVPLSLKDTNLPERSFRTSVEGFFDEAMSKKDVTAGGKRVERATVNRPMAAAVAVSRSPLTGFRTQEEKGKALPCFGVKEDGLMRITSSTLKDLVSGVYADTVSRYQIVDCRFSYEFEGGHIAQAINLPTTTDVEQVLLSCDGVPVPSTSEDRPKSGKTVLIFHCEFSAKRAPTSAKHLRSKDRLLNVGCYPNVHYPEVYVLAGGYVDFWKAYPSHCEGVGYVSMDDPDHLAKRSVDLNTFRQQKRQFNRAKSFTFGEATSVSSTLLTVAMGTRPTIVRQKSLAPSGFVFPPTPLASTLLASSAVLISQLAASTITIAEEEHETTGDTSFGTNTTGSSPSAPGGAGESPCPANNKTSRFSLKMGWKNSSSSSSSHQSQNQGTGGRRMGLERAQTSAVLMFGGR